MHRSLPVLAAALLGIAAGWFLRGEPAKPPEKKSAIAPASATVTAKAAPATAPPGIAAAWTDAGGAGPQAFASLQELLTLVDDLDTDDELSSMEAFNGVPRLLATDLTTTRRLLSELEGMDHPQGETRGILAFSLLARWMLQEPEGAIEFGMKHPGVFGPSPDEDIMQQFASMGIVMAAKKNPAAAQSLVAMLPKDGQEEGLAMLQTIQATHDPEGVLKSLPPDKSDEAQTIVGNWARHDPQAALRWASSQPEEERDDLLKAVAGGWAKKDWKGAAQWVAGLPGDGEDRGEIYSAIASAISKSLPSGATPADAHTTLAGVAQPIADRVLLALVSNGSQGEDFQARAAGLLEGAKRNGTDSGFQGEAANEVTSMVNLMVKGPATDGKAAAEWTMTLPPGPAQEAAVTALTGSWADKDAAGASAWVAALPAGELREKASVQLIEKMAGSDPPQALKWAQSLTDEEQRTEQIGKVMRQWLPENPFAAMKAIQALPASVRKEIWDPAAP